MCRVSAEVEHDRWRKLVYNAVLNPVCAILGMDTGRLRLAGGGGVVEGVVRPAMGEVVEAARACGVELVGEVVGEMIASDPLESYLRPSMLVDVRKVSWMLSHFLLSFSCVSSFIVLLVLLFSLHFVQFLGVRFVLPSSSHSTPPDFEIAFCVENRIGELSVARAISSSMRI